MEEIMLQVVLTTLAILPPALFILFTILSIVSWSKFKKRNGKLAPAIVFTVLSGSYLISMIIEGWIIFSLAMTVANM